MKSVSVSFVPLVIMLFLTVTAMKPTEGFNCLVTKLSLLPCLPFLITNAQTPLTSCCIALSYLNSSVRTISDLGAACECLVEAAASIPNLHKDKVVELSKLCNIHVAFPITTNINCGM